MQIPDARSFIKAFEGCKLAAYPDANGKLTIGWGHTGTEVQHGLVWTQEQADKQFEIDFGDRTWFLDKLDLGLSSGQLLAVQSLVYNTGRTPFLTSHLLVCIRAKDWLGAAKEFQRWDHTGPHELNGLLHRRLAEALIFIASSTN